MIDKTILNECVINGVTVLDENLYLENGFTFCGVKTSYAVL